MIIIGTLESADKWLSTYFKISFGACFVVLVVSRVEIRGRERIGNWRKYIQETNREVHHCNVIIQEEI